jgi:hypothetical protein
MEISSKILLSLLAVSVLVVIVATADKFLVERDYYFSLEAQCDPTERSCFVRDCAVDECPPNELENYRIFEVAAADFDFCSENDCLRECESGKVRCMEVECDENADDACSGRPLPQRMIESDVDNEYLQIDVTNEANSTSTTSDHDETDDSRATSTFEILI